MRLAIYSRTALAAAPWELYKALKKYTTITTVLINQRANYRDGRSFPHDLLLGNNNGLAMAALEGAEIWHVHNYLDDALEKCRRNQRVLAQFHSLPRLGNWAALMNFSDINYTIRQPLHEIEYRLPGLPNIIDPDEYRPIHRPGKIRIAFAPSSRTPIGRPDSKGYVEVNKILSRVAELRDVEIELIEGKPYLENLKIKQSCHILIDDVVTGNWHRTSLEGCCFGMAVLNALEKEPFVHATIKTLLHKLLELIDHPARLQQAQECSRLWVLQHWHAMDKIKDYTQAYRGLQNGK